MLKIEGMEQATFPLDEGQATLQWPRGMSRDSCDDFKAWVSLVLKKVGRSVNAPDEPEGHHGP